MISVVNAALIFTVTLIVHIILIRLSKSSRSDPLISAMVFLAGFLTILNVDSSIVALSVYLLISLAYLIFYIAPFSGEESPSTSILVECAKRNLSHKDIFSLFTNDQLILTRIEKFLDQGILEKKNGRYSIKMQGKFIVFVINSYRKLLGWKVYG